MPQTSGAVLPLVIKVDVSLQYSDDCYFLVLIFNGHKTLQPCFLLKKTHFKSVGNLFVLKGLMEVTMFLM